MAVFRQKAAAPPVCWKSNTTECTSLFVLGCFYSFLLKKKDSCCCFRPRRGTCREFTPPPRSQQRGLVACAPLRKIVNPTNTKPTELPMFSVQTWWEPKRYTRPRHDSIPHFLFLCSKSREPFWPNWGFCFFPTGSAGDGLGVPEGEGRSRWPLPEPGGKHQETRQHPPDQHQVMMPVWPLWT